MLPPIMALTDTKTRNTRRGDKPVKLTDSGGLYLEMRPNGSKLWRYRYRIAGRENIFAIGKYYNDTRGDHVSLAEARGIRDEAEIGRASCRERVKISVVAVSFNKI